MNDINVPDLSDTPRTSTISRYTHWMNMMEDKERLMSPE